MRLPYGTVLKDEQTVLLLLLHGVKTSVSSLRVLLFVSMMLIFFKAFYTKFQNRGYLSKQLLTQLGSAPFVEDRWALLSRQLGKFQRQEFDVVKKKK